MTAPGTTSVAYLGPEGTFTHQAVAEWSRANAAGEPPAAVPLATVGDVYSAVAGGTVAFGIVAIESTVEGYVVPSLDALIAAPDVVAVGETVLDISFDAFVRPGHGDLRTISAHPHGLAQCQGFVEARGLRPVPADSNAAACRDVAHDQVALGPALCGELYGLETIARGVQDFRGGRTRFLTLVRRSDAAGTFAGPAGTVRPAQGWHTMVAITPLATGPGVLARITAAFGAAGVNMSSLITRPLKAQEGKYVFVVTVDAAPWERGARAVLGSLLDAGDSLKTLGVFAASSELDDSLDLDHVPPGAAHPGSRADEVDAALLWSEPGA